STHRTRRERPSSTTSRRAGGVGRSRKCCRSSSPRRRRRRRRASSSATTPARSTGSSRIVPRETVVRKGATMRGFKNFLMQGQLVVVAVGLSIALAFSTLVKAFTDTVVTPLVNAAGGGGTEGLGFTVRGQLVDIGAFVSALIYFVIFVAVVYFAIVVPY